MVFQTGGSIVGPRFLILFRGVHQDFRLAELYAVTAHLRGCTEEEVEKDMCVVPALRELVSSVEVPQDVAGVVLHGHVLCFANLRSVEEASVVGRQCVLIRAILIPVVHGRNYAECVSQSMSESSLSLCADMLQSDPPRSFKCVVTCFGRSYSVQEQLVVMERFADLFNSFPGQVQMKEPDEEFWIVEDAFPKAGHKTDSLPAESQQVFLARKVISGASHLGNRFHLRRRKHLGPTSTNAELAFVMANMAHVKKGDLVLDPFCGSGSILVSCSARGAVVMGADLDYKVLRAASHGRAMDPNFDQYDLSRPVGVVRADMLRSAFRAAPWVDAIVCDPPYGVREGARGFRDDGGLPQSQTYISGTERVRFVDIIDGLLEFAAKRLVPGGRLVYWLPTTPDYCDEDLPRHRDYRLVASSNQVLTMRMHRRLVTMRRLTVEEEKLRDAKLPSMAGQRVESEKCAPGFAENRAHVPAHADFSAKIIRDTRRSEVYMKPSRFPSTQPL